MSKETIPVTLILTHYRRPHTVIKALISLAEQTVQPAEVIIIDDYSPRGEWLVLYSHIYCNLHYLPGELRIRRTPFNVGLGKTRNMAIDLATQPYIALMDDDDTWHPQKLEFQWEAFERHPMVSGSFCFTWAMRGSIVKRFPAYRWTNMFNDLYLGDKINHVPAPTMLINREMLAYVGGWGRTRHAEDLSTALRLSAVCPAYCVDKPLIYSDPYAPSLSTSRKPLLQVMDYLRSLTEGARFAVRCGRKLPVPLWLRYKQVLINYVKGSIVSYFNPW